QRASERALANGASLRWSLEVAKRIRGRTDAALLAMTYYNVFYRYGIDAFVADAVSAGLDGVIVPDLPLSEGDALRAAGDKAGLYVIPLVAPTSTDAH